MRLAIKGLQGAIAFRSWIRNSRIASSTGSQGVPPGHRRFEDCDVLESLWGASGRRE